jgi:hypothetical protein
VVINTDIPGNSVARRPDGRGRGLLRRHAGEKRRSIRGTSFCGLHILLVLSNAVSCYKGMRHGFWMSHARSCIVNRLREESVEICMIIANELIKILT